MMMSSNAEGHAVVAVFPYVAGIAQGMLKASAEGPGCLPYVVLPWGAEPLVITATPQLEPPKAEEPGATDSKQGHTKKSLLQKLHKSGQ
jgi:hypothetical protein